jgi:hypothetical protein
MPAALKRPRTPSPDFIRRSLSPLTPPPPSPRPSSSKVKREASDSPQKSKKLQLLATYASTSPFPDYARPSPAEAREVHALLVQQYPELAATTRIADENNDAAGTCGKVPNVIESLIGTSTLSPVRGRRPDKVYRHHPLPEHVLQELDRRQALARHHLWPQQLRRHRRRAARGPRRCHPAWRPS